MQKLLQTELDEILNEHEANLKTNKYHQLSFENIDFTHCSFSRQNLEEAIFKNCILDNALFNRSNLKSSKFIDISAKGTFFIEANMSFSLIDNMEFDEETNFSGCHFEGAKIIYSASNFFRANFNRSTIYLASEGIFDRFINYFEPRYNLVALFYGGQGGRVWTDFFNGEIAFFKEAILEKYGNKHIPFSEMLDMERTLERYWDSAFDDNFDGGLDTGYLEYQIKIAKHRPFYITAYHIFSNYIKSGRNNSHSIDYEI